MKLSIITINYNNLDGLKKTVQSVISQTWRDFEWIIIDGGSTDGSKELIEELAKTPSLRERAGVRLYWCSEPDKGVYNAMNKGIAKAQGEYINFMNSGDVFAAPDVLEKVFAEDDLQDSPADIIYGDWIRIEKEGERFMSPTAGAFMQLVFFENVCHQAMFTHRKWLTPAGFDERFKVYADWKKNIDISLAGGKAKYVPIAVCKFDALEAGLSETYKGNELDMAFEDPSVPKAIKYWRERFATNTTYSWKWEAIQKSQLTMETYKYVYKKPLYAKIIGLAVKVIKLID